MLPKLHFLTRRKEGSLSRLNSDNSATSTKRSGGGGSGGINLNESLNSSNSNSSSNAAAELTNALLAAQTQTQTTTNKIKCETIVEEQQQNHQHGNSNSNSSGDVSLDRRKRMSVGCAGAVVEGERTSSYLKTNRFARDLGLLEITCVGVATSLNGIYLIVGEAIKNESGPSVIISFMLAGLITLLAGLCYAELSAKEPDSESAYSYTYIIIGEFWAFCMGWNFILQYIIGVSSDARALSQNIDSLFDFSMKKLLKTVAPIAIFGFSDYPDILAFALVVIMIGVLIIGVKESSIFNKFVNSVNGFVILFIIAYGATKINFSNWKINVDDILFLNQKLNQTASFADVEAASVNRTTVDNGVELFTSRLPTINTETTTPTTTTTAMVGVGGFFPFGIAGMLRSVNKCFYAFIGFDTIYNEVVNPQRNIPLAIISAISICLLCFLGLASILSLIVPYYLVDEVTPFQTAFAMVSPEWAQYFRIIISIGIIMSITASLYAEVYVMPRIVCSMATDGLLFKFLSRINKKFKTPHIATIITGILSAIFAMIFKLDELIDMMSLCSLAGYCVTALCLIVARFMPDLAANMFDFDDVASMLTTTNQSQQQQQKRHRLLRISEYLRNKIANSFIGRRRHSTYKSSMIVNVLVVIITSQIISICLLLKFQASFQSSLWTTVLVLIAVLVAMILVELIAIYIQPQNSNYDTFKVPLVPFLPIISCFFNIYLMLNLSGFIWICLLIWLAIGLIVYFTYGIRNSVQKHKSKSNKNKNGGDKNASNPNMYHQTATEASKATAGDGDDGGDACESDILNKKTKKQLNILI